MTLFRDLLIDKKRRKYYCEVEYLQSSGTQYINTGIIPSAGMRIVIKAESLNNTTWAGYIGSWDRDNSSTAISIRQQTSNTLVAPSYGGNPGAYSTTVTADAHIFELKEGEFYVDGVQKLTWTTVTTSLSTYPIFMFVENLGGNPWNLRYSSLKVYFCKIYKDNVLIRDLIPVLDWSYTPCMYDKISGKLFYNQGTGNFTYGREIHYVDYLESTGTQYILSGFTPTLNTDYEVTLSSTSTGVNRWVMGCPTWVGVHYRGTANEVGVTCGSSSTYQQYVSYAQDDSKLTMRLTGNTVYANDVLLGTITKKAGTLDFALFGYRDANQGATILFIGSIYKTKIWDNNTLVRDYKPAIDENGVGFMFDRVTHTCFLNKGTGSFVVPTYQVDGNGRIEEPRYE